MYWKVDSMVENRITGWAYDPKFLHLNLNIVAIIGSQVCAKAIANLPREDLVNTWHRRTNCGFVLDIADDININEVEVICTSMIENRSGFILYSPIRKSGTFYPSYQSFTEGEGLMASALKLKQLCLPDLRNLAVLDLGCNEGFFCQVALEAGAKRVVGIDQSSFILEKAKSRIENYEELKQANILEFKWGSWYDVPEEKFDIILFLSAVHYEKEQKKLFDHLQNHLTPTGTLVLECGVVDGYPLHHWIKVHRPADAVPRRFPTRTYLYQELLSSYSVRAKGKSITEDVVDRYIFHCNSKKKTVCVVRGKSGMGKTTLAWLFAKQGISVFSTDNFFNFALGKYLGPYQNNVPKTPFYRYMVEKVPAHSLGGVIHQFVEAGFLDEFVEEFIDYAPLDGPLTIIEGETFTDPIGYEALKRKLEERGYSVWSIEKN